MRKPTNVPDHNVSDNLSWFVSHLRYGIVRKWVAVWGHGSTRQFMNRQLWDIRLSDSCQEQLLALDSLPVLRTASKPIQN